MKRPLACSVLLFSLATAAIATELFDPNRLALAIANQQSLIDQSPGNALLWNDLGNLLLLAERSEEAADAYRKSTELDPQNADAFFNLGLLLQEEELFTDAISSYKAVLEIEPENARSNYQLGAIAEQTGQRKAAIAFYAQAFQLDPYLLFPDINPQILRNRLVTEAIMVPRASRDHSRVTRVYADSDRITRLLVPPVPQKTPEPQAPVVPTEVAPAGSTSNAFQQESDETEEFEDEGDEEEDDAPLVGVLYDDEVPEKKPKASSPQPRKPTSKKSRKVVRD